MQINENAIKAQRIDQEKLNKKCALSSSLIKVSNTHVCDTSDMQFITCGIDIQAGDYDLAQIACDVYETESALPKAGFRRFTQEDLQHAGLDNVTLRDKHSGFQAHFYHNGHQVVLAFAGTDESQDWVTNLHESFGYQDKQYLLALDLAYIAHQKFGDRLVMTGHSLGGSLATTAAIAVGSLAVTFNSAGVAETTLTRLGITPARAKFRSENGSIRFYSQEYDPLYSLQSLLPFLPDPLGHKITLKKKDKLSLVHFLHRVITAHQMKEVVTSVQQAVKCRI